MAKKRIDELLLDRGCFASRARAQRAIRAGWVRVDGRRASKPGQLCPDDSSIRVQDKPRYVSRGGDKLKGALESFRLEVKGLVVLDVGASTGGFTDCLLQEGARRVYSLDVGKGQLDWRLRQDPRVRVKEGFNARYLSAEDLPEAVDLVTVDVSFISLSKVLTSVSRSLKAGGFLLALIKPQFEAGREEVGRGGVVRDPAIQRKVIQKISDFLLKRRMKVRGVSESRLQGPAGNREFFILARK